MPLRPSWKLPEPLSKSASNPFGANEKSGGDPIPGLLFKYPAFYVNVPMATIEN
jgi:hypothetical protein